MTSNLGSHYIQELVDNEKEMEQKVNEILRNSFRPEFLNRVDETIIFKSLDRDHLTMIVEIQINHLRDRLEEKRIGIELSDQAKVRLVDIGYDPVYGARPLKRTIQKYIQDPVATKLLQGDFKEGDSIKVDIGKDDNFSFTN